MTYTTVAGQEKTAPAFEAVYFELWSARRASAVTEAPAAAMPAQVTAAAATTYSRCLSEASGVMPDMIECSATEAKRQDARLNAAYKKAMASLSNKDSLRSTQRQWIKDRDKACELDSDGGQQAILVYNDCLAQKPAPARTNWKPSSSPSSARSP